MNSTLKTYVITIAQQHSPRSRPRIKTAFIQADSVFDAKNALVLSRVCTMDEISIVRTLPPDKMCVYVCEGNISARPGGQV